MTNEATTPSGQPLGISHKPSKSVAMFTKFKAENKPAFIGYLPYGFPNPDVSLDAFKTMVEHGVDAVEIGLPYSDPVMDGPVIQAAASIAPEQRRDHQARVRGRRNRGQRRRRAAHHELLEPRVPLRRRALRPRLRERRWRRSHHPGPYPGRGGEWIEASDCHGLDRIFLVSPDSSTERLETVARNARVASCTRPPAWASPANAPPSTPRPNSSWNVPVRPVPRTCAWASACPPPNRAPRSAPYADGVIVGSALVHTLLADDNKTARDPKEGLKLLAAKSEELAEGIHNAR